MHGVIGSRLGEGAARLAAFASVVGFAVLIGWEAVVGATVLKNFSGVSPTAYFLLPVVLVFISSLYTGSGGLRGNALINLAQNAIKIFALIFAAFVLLALVGTDALFESRAATTGAYDAFMALGGVALAANLIFSLFWQVVDMSAWQNIAATPGDSRRSAIGLSMASILFFPGIIGTVLGIALSGVGTASSINDSNILNALVEALQGAPWIGLAVVAAFAASMLSTIDGYALAASQASTWDLLFPKRVKALLSLGPDRSPNQDDLAVLTTGRVFVLFVAMAGAIGVLQLVLNVGVSLFDLVYAVVVAQMSLVGPVMLCLLRPRGVVIRMGYLPIFLSLLAGGGCVLARFWGHDQFYIWAPVITVGTSLVLTWVVSRIEAARTGDVVLEGAGES
ncbi:hypothetical protein [Sphingomonas sp.]|jgi:Na+/proline symporter|uniref:hypothetical protein n=1 Tax=Sphingomonas sp. TaxID=28214 RepID=UPI002ED79C13